MGIASMSFILRSPKRRGMTGSGGRISEKYTGFHGGERK
jgi:hypothetical protein